MTVNPQSNELLRPAYAARILSLSVSTLAKMRMRGDGPAFIKLGSRAVAYRREDLDYWIAQRRRSSTARISKDGGPRK